MNMTQKLSKFKIIFLIVVLAVILVFALYLIFGLNGSSYRSVKIVEAEGTVTIERDDVGRLDAGTNMNLVLGDRIMTDADSYAVLLLDTDKYVYLDSLGEIKVISEGDEIDGKIQIELEKGTILNEIQNPLEKGSSYEIKTPNATMSVRGTVFETRRNVENKDIELLVYDGIVALDLGNGEEALYTKGEYTKFEDNINPSFIVERDVITDDIMNVHIKERLDKIFGQGRNVIMGETESQKYDKNKSSDFTKDVSENVKNKSDEVDGDSLNRVTDDVNTNRNNYSENQVFNNSSDNRVSNRNLENNLNDSQNLNNITENREINNNLNNGENLGQNLSDDVNNALDNNTNDSQTNQNLNNITDSNNQNNTNVLRDKNENNESFDNNSLEDNNALVQNSSEQLAVPLNRKRSGSSGSSRRTGSNHTVNVTEETTETFTNTEDNSTTEESLIEETTIGSLTVPSETTTEETTVNSSESPFESTTEEIIDYSTEEVTESVTEETTNGGDVFENAVVVNVDDKFSGIWKHLNINIGNDVKTIIGDVYEGYGISDETMWIEFGGVKVINGSIMGVYGNNILYIGGNGKIVKLNNINSVKVDFGKWNGIDIIAVDIERKENNSGNTGGSSGGGNHQKPGETNTEEPTESSSETNTEESTESSSETVIEKPEESSSETNTEESTENYSETSTEKITEESTNNFIESSTENKTEKPVINNPTEKDTEKTTIDFTENSTEESTEGTTQKPGGSNNPGSSDEKTTETITEKTTFNSMESTTEESTINFTESTTEDFTETTTEITSVDFMESTTSEPTVDSSIESTTENGIEESTENSSEDTSREDESETKAKVEVNYLLLPIIPNNDFYTSGSAIQIGSKNYSISNNLEEVGSKFKKPYGTIINNSQLTLISSANATLISELDFLAWCAYGSQTQIDFEKDTVDKATKIYALWENRRTGDIYYPVIFNDVYEGLSCGGSIKNNTKLNVVPEDKDGYTFKYWKTDDGEVWNGIVDGPKYLTPVWEESSGNNN